jgi:hypothetical protein
MSELLRNLFTSAETAKRYMLAGHAIVTLNSKITNAHFTYKIVRAKLRASEEVAPHFVSVLAAAENGADESYRYLGTIFGESQFRLTRKSGVSLTAPSYVAFAWTWNNLMAGHLCSALEIWHEGVCGRCGRLLTVPESIAAGIGPVCAEMGA